MRQTPTERLLDSFRKHAKGYLNPSDLAFCESTINQGSTLSEKRRILTDYISETSRNAGKTAQETSIICNYIENYQSIFESLLLSYVSVGDNLPQIAEKHYKETIPMDVMILLVLPMYGLIIRVEKYSENAWHGSREDRAGNLMVVRVFRERSRDDWGLIFDGSFIDTHYPYYSTTCSIKCDSNIKTDLYMRMQDGSLMTTPLPECRMSPNRERICQRAKGIADGLGTSQVDFLGLVMMCYDKWKNRPIRQGTKKANTYSDKGVSTVFVGTPPGKGQIPIFREVRLSEITKQTETLRASGWKIENRASPVEHDRREHTRTLKSGKVVPIRGSVVNKGKGQAIFRIEG